LLKPEPTLSSEKVFQGRIITVQVDQIAMPDGQTATREIVRFPPGVAVLAVTQERKIIL
jgi:ADP-ribose pyrophosphatase